MISTFCFLLSINHLLELMRILLMGRETINKKQVRRTFRNHSVDEVYVTLA